MVKIYPIIKSLIPYLCIENWRSVETQILFPSHAIIPAFFCVYFWHDAKIGVWGTRQSPSFARARSQAQPRTRNISGRQMGFIIFHFFYYAAHLHFDMALWAKTAGPLLLWEISAWKDERWPLRYIRLKNWVM